MARMNREEWTQDLRKEFDLNFCKINKVLVDLWWEGYNKVWDLWEKGQWVDYGMGTEDGFESFWNEMRFPHYINNTTEQIIGEINPNTEAYMLWLSLESMDEDDPYYTVIKDWYARRMTEWRNAPDTHQVYWWGDETYPETCYL